VYTICVFAGSHTGKPSHYAEAATALGAEIARRGIELVYGGGGVGLMGLLAESALDHGGRVIGVMPEGLFSTEAAHRQLTEFYQVGSMHERKKLMSDLADGFIALPGGFGTFDELVEIITWAQIGIHHKPIVLLNIDDYFAPFFALIKRAVTDGFIQPEYTQLFGVVDDVRSAVDLVEAAFADHAALQPHLAPVVEDETMSANGASATAGIVGRNGAHSSKAPAAAPRTPQGSRQRHGKHAPIPTKHDAGKPPPAP